MLYYVCNLRILALNNFTFCHTLYVLKRDSENNRVTGVAVTFTNRSYAASCSIYSKDTFFGGKGAGAW